MTVLIINNSHALYIYTDANAQSFMHAAGLNQEYGAVHNPLEDSHRQRAQGNIYNTKYCDDLHENSTCTESSPITANIGARLGASGRHTPRSARSDDGSEPDFNGLLSDHEGYESAV